MCIINCYPRLSSQHLTAAPSFHAQRAQRVVHTTSSPSQICKDFDFRAFGFSDINSALYEMVTEIGTLNTALKFEK